MRTHRHAINRLTDWAHQDRVLHKYDMERTWERKRARQRAKAGVVKL